MRTRTYFIKSKQLKERRNKQKTEYLRAIESFQEFDRLEQNILNGKLRPNINEYSRGFAVNGFIRVKRNEQLSNLYL